MSQPRILSEGVSSPSVSLADFVAFNERVSGLNLLLQASRHVFSSPLGPYVRAGRHHHVPRYVYFGAEGSPESLRLAFHAGLDVRDLRGTLALLGYIERIAQNPGLANGLNLTFFPLANIGGLRGTSPRGLAHASWLDLTSPEISLLAQDARAGGYHGFVRIETNSAETDTIVVRLRGQVTEENSFELVSTEGLEEWSVRWEAYPGPAADGPLSLSDDLPTRPYELIISLPAAWEFPRQESAAHAILGQFIRRYRTFQAYAQHL